MRAHLSPAWSSLSAPASRGKWCRHAPQGTSPVPHKASVQNACIPHLLVSQSSFGDLPPALLVAPLGPALRQVSPLLVSPTPNCSLCPEASRHPPYSRSWRRLGSAMCHTSPVRLNTGLSGISCVERPATRSSSSKSTRLTATALPAMIAKLLKPCTHKEGMAQMPKGKEGEGLAGLRAVMDMQHC